MSGHEKAEDSNEGGDAGGEDDFAVLALHGEQCLHTGP